MPKETSHSDNAPEDVSGVVSKGLSGVFKEDARDDDAPAPAEPLPREEIAALRSWCHARLGSGCSRCQTACPHQAITLGADGPTIDEAACTRCGLCAGVCDAFAWERITLADLVKWAHREAEGEGFVCFTCADHVFTDAAPRSNVMALPCLAAVPPEFWSALLAEGVKVSIYRDPAYCDDCFAAGAYGAPLFAHALDAAQLWTGQAARLIDRLPERESLLAFAANVNTDDRRELFEQLTHEGLDIASGKHRRRNAGTVGQFQEKQERMRAKGRIRNERYTTGTPTRARPRQELAVQAARGLPERAGDWVRWCADVDAGCASAKACADACPTGAFKSNNEGAAVDVKRCIACGCCVNACVDGTVTFRETTAGEYLE